LETVRDFGDQYLWLMARPCRKPSLRWRGAGNDLEELARDVQEFQQSQGAIARMWQQRLDRAAAEGRRPVLWGAGSKSVALLSALGGGDQIQYVVDINPHKHGKYLPGSGHQIVAPDFLSRYRPELVVVMNPIYRDEIEVDLYRRGIQAEVIACEPQRISTRSQVLWQNAGT
jgi:hypothetical protein